MKNAACPNKNTQEWRSLVELTGSETAAYVEYIKNDFNIPEVDSALLDKDIITGQLTKQQIQLEKYREAVSLIRDKGISALGTPLDAAKWSNNKVSYITKKIYENISNMTGIHARALTMEEAAALVNGNDVDFAGIYYKDRRLAFVVKDYASPGTLIHEAFMHPFLILLKNTNNDLYNKLLNESKSNKQIYDYVQDNYANDGLNSYNEDALNDEYITHAMNLLVSDRLTDQVGEESGLKRLKIALNAIYNRFKVWIRDLFNLNSINRLSSSTTLDDLFNIIQHSWRKGDWNEELIKYSNSIESDASNKMLYDRDIPESRTRDVSSIKDIFNNISSNVDFIEESHKYINNKTGKEYTSTSDIKKTTQYSDNIEDGDNKYIFAAEVGTSIHNFLESIQTGEKTIQSVPLSVNARNQLRDLSLIWDEKFETIAVEQTVVDDVKMIAGRLDRIVRDKSTGNIITLDYKTKIVDVVDSNGNSMQIGLDGKPYRKIPFKYYKYTTNGTPDIKKHNFQQTMYKRLLELSGIDIKYKGIVPLEVVIQIDDDGNKLIYDISVTKNLPVNSAKYFTLIADTDVSGTVDSILDISRNKPTELLNTIINDRLIAIANDGISLLKKRSASLSIQGLSIKSKMLADDIDALSKLDAINVIYNIVELANQQMIYYKGQYNKSLAEEKVKGLEAWSMTSMKIWQDFALAFDGLLDNIQMIYLENPDILNEIDGINRNEFEQMLSSTINDKNMLKSAYAIKGKPKWMDWMAQGSKFIEYKYKQDFESNYKREFYANNNSLPKSDRVEFNVDEMNSAMDDYIKSKSNEIDIETRRFIDDQSRIASDDINIIYRYADNIFDSKDPIIGTMAKQYYNNLLDMRIEYNNWYIDLDKIVSEFDSKYRTSTFDNDQEVYDYMLEYVDAGIDKDGNKITTAKLVQEVPQKFIDDYNKFRNDTMESLKDAGEFSWSRYFTEVNDWINEHAPQTDDDISNQAADIRSIYNKLNEDGKITDDEYVAVIQNYESDYPLSINRMAKDNIISSDAAEVLYKETSKIKWKYRRPDKKLYPNSKYDAINNMDTSDPKRKLYEFFVATLSKGNESIPARYNLGMSIPGIRKDSLERITSSDDKVRSISREFKQQFQYMEDDANRGATYELANELDEGIKFVPVYFSTPITVEEQSFDLPTIFSKWNMSVLNYSHTQNVLPMLEYTKKVINERRMVKSKDGSPIKNILSSVFNKNNPTSEELSTYVNSTTNRIAEQLNDWFDQVIYGKADKYLGKIGGADIAKTVRLMNKFTSFRIMGLNFLSMINNTALAEVNQSIEAISGRLMTAKEYTKATKIYALSLPDILGDVGRRRFESKVNLALEYFNIFFEMHDNKFREKSRAARLFKTSALFVTTNLGEHEAQARFLIGALLNYKVKDKSGKDAGNLWDNLIIEDGKLKVNESVAVDEKDIASISRSVTQVLRSMHGNYSDYSSVAMSANAASSMALMFRKWIIPAWRRRYDRNHFSEFSETMQTGYIREGASFAWNNAKSQYYKVMTFFNKLSDESRALDAAVAADWNMLNEYQKQAVKRLGVDISIFLSAILIYSMLSAIRDDDDDKLSDIEKSILDNLMYQVYRARTEQMFYVNPKDFMTIVNSPLPTVSTFGGLLDTTIQVLTNPTERYQQGRHKGDLKSFWKTYREIPIVRQIYRVINSEDSLNALIKPF